MALDSLIGLRGGVRRKGVSTLSQRCPPSQASAADHQSRVIPVLLLLVPFVLLSLVTLQLAF